MLLRKKLVFNVSHTLPRFHVDSNLRPLICKSKLFFTGLEESKEATYRCKWKQLPKRKRLNMNKRDLPKKRIGPLFFLGRKGEYVQKRRTERDATE